MIWESCIVAVHFFRLIPKLQGNWPPQGNLVGKPCFRVQAWGLGLSSWKVLSYHGNFNELNRHREALHELSTNPTSTRRKPIRAKPDACSTGRMCSALESLYSPLNGGLTMAPLQKQLHRQGPQPFTAVLLRQPQCREGAKHYPEAMNSRLTALNS